MLTDQRSITPKIILVLLSLAAFSSQSHADTNAQQYNDGVTTYNSGNYEEAISIWRNLANKGYQNAQYSLGVAYFNGEGVIRDLNEAIDWFELAADGGNVQAMFNMGSAYYQGNGTEQNFEKAVEWWRKAGELEQPSAQYNLGLAYYFGKGVEQDLSQASDWLRQATDNGHSGAQDALTLIQKEIADTKSPIFSEEKQTQRDDKNEAVVDSLDDTAEENEIISANYQAAIVSKLGGQAYASQNLNGTVLANLTDGNPIKVLKVEKDWAKINVPGVASAWVYKKYLNNKKDGSATIKGTLVRARSLPSTGSNSIIIGIFDENEDLIVLNELDSWSQVVAPVRMDLWMPILALEILPSVTKKWDQQWKHAVSVIVKKSKNSVQIKDKKETNLVIEKKEKTDNISIRGSFQAAFVGTTRAEVLGTNKSDAPLLTTLVEGSPVKIIDVQPPWAAIQTPGPVQVWVYGKYVIQNGDKAKISGIDVRARSRPSTTGSSNVLGIFLDKTPVRVISKEGDWVRVSAVDIAIAWMLLEDLEIFNDISEEWIKKWNKARKEL